MIQDLHTSFMLPAELISTTDSILTILQPVTTEESFLQKLHDTLLQDIKELQSVLGRERGSETTQQLLEKDEFRDSNYVAFRDYVKACTKRPQAEVAQAAELIIAIIRKQGWTLYALSYPQESAALRMLFDDLSTPEATAAIQTIGAETWLNDLKNAQAAFDEMYQTKISTAQAEDFPLLRDAKTKLGRDLAALLESVRILTAMGNEDVFGPVVSKINEVIRDIMTTVRARKTREKNESENPADSPLEEDGNV